MLQRLMIRKLKYQKIQFLKRYDFRIQNHNSHKLS